MEKIKAFCVKYGALILIFLMCLMLRGCIDVYKGMTQPPAATVTAEQPAAPEAGAEAGQPPAEETAPDAASEG